MVFGSDTSSNPNADGTRKRKVIFITGTGHCGSTLLDLILGSHSDAFSLGQVSKIPDCLKQEEGGICEICGPGCTFWESDDAQILLKRYFRGALTAGFIDARVYWRIGSLRTDLYAALSRLSGADMLIDSSKTPWWIRRQLRSAWYWRNATPYLIFVQRDGRAVVNSLLRKRGRDQLDPVVRGWMNSVEEIETFYDSFPWQRRMRLAYETLAANPETTVRQLCAFLGILYEPEMLRYWRHGHHLISGNAGTYSLIQRYRSQFAGVSLPGYLGDDKPSPDSHRDYYEQLGMAIRLDLRWKEEMSPYELKRFDELTGAANHAYAYSR